MATIIQTIHAKDTLHHLTRFLTVGALGTLIDFSLFTLLKVFFSVPILPANITAYSAGIVNNFFLHRHWTFSGRPRKALTIQFIQFLLVSLSAMTLNSLIVLVLSQPLGSFLGYSTTGILAAKACATAAGLVWNFFTNYFWTFKDKSKKS